ncbi:MAG TPA: glycosyltransferase family 4 protein [Sphingobium sp.]|nr:glycosyltransferase family 4 protein [Sphingobium sp.]
MKAVMVDPSLFTGRYDDCLCAALGARGHEVTLLGRPLRETDAIEPAGYDYAPRFFRIGERLRGSLGERRFARAVKAFDYALDCRMGSLAALKGDVAHFQWLPFAMADRWLLGRLGRHTALVHTVHNARPYHGDRAATAQARGYLELLSRFDALIAHGERTAEALLAQGIDAAQIHIVPHPPMQLAAATPADMAALPPAAVPRILFFGTIRPYKGLDLLLQACLTLWREGLDFELAIVGKPFMPIEPFLGAIHGGGFGHRLIADLSFVTEQRLDAHLRAADICAFPYRAIDSSGAFLSALRYGAAMVTSDAGMFGELPGDVAARFPVGRADVLTATLRPLIRNARLRRKAGQAALNYGAVHSGWDEAAALTEQAYLAAQERFRGRRA